MADPQPKDRRAALLGSASLNGIDFVEVAGAGQAVLRVHFLNAVPLVGPLSATIDGGETIRQVVVLPIAGTDFETASGHLILTLNVAAPGDFSNYALTLVNDGLDRFFSRVRFSFKVNCPSDLDCRQPAPPCPPPDADVPPIDYLAKDFLSFRQALLDFSALRYPEWQERSEADFGVMFLEALSSLADDLSYTQDRVAAEASLETATQRRSLVRLARLVDYEPAPPIAARAVLQFDVDDGVREIPHGLLVVAPGPDVTPIPFETGDGLVDRLIDPGTGRRRTAVPVTEVRRAWNKGILPYWFDDADRCIEVGATEMYVLGRGYDFAAGQSLLIETRATVSADPPLRQIVQLVEAGFEDCDPLFPRPVDAAGPPFLTCEPSTPGGAIAPTAVTRLRWRDVDRLTEDRDLTRTVVAGNLVRATQGATVADEAFAIANAPPGHLTTPPAVRRTGPRPLLPDGTPGEAPPQHLHTLDAAPLAWLVPPGPDARPLPEVLLEQAAPDGTPQQSWPWLRQMLDAEQLTNAFTLDAARYRKVARNSADGSIQYEYDGDAGDTIRFGDGVFGEIPDDQTLFKVTYRVGAGAAGNVAADAINRLDAGAIAGVIAGVIAVGNPLPATGGADAEPAERVRRLAPQAFRAVQFRAVRAEDYGREAQTLPWVQRAGAVFRWTGSWPTVFTTPDPLHSERVTIGQRTELIDLLNRRRIAGYESYVPEPRYLSLDVEVQVRARPDAFRGDVEAAVLESLDARHPAGFFNPDHFTFGQPLERSRLEAAAQRAQGVAGVLCVHYRARGRTAGLVEMPGAVPVGTNEIIRCDNDPSVPEHGSLKVVVKGGK